MRYAELQVTTHFSFLRGASSAIELFETAKSLGIDAIGVVDRNSLAGIVRALEASRATGVRLVVGCRLDLQDGMSILVYPTDRTAYSRLARLITLGKGRGGKDNCILMLDDIAQYGEGLLGILVPDLADDTCAVQLRKMAEVFGDLAYLSLCLRRRPNDQLRLHELSNMATRFKVKTVVTNDVLFHEPGRRQLQDIVTCIRNNTTIDTVGFERERHADRYLKPPEEMERLFPRYRQALRRTMEIVDRCKFSLEELTYQYPEEAIVPRKTAQESLEHYVWQCVPDRYPQGLPPKTLQIIRHELDLIHKMKYAPYFLTVFSIVRFARAKGILCQGRGSAANSAVCYILGVTSIDPETNNLLFERFVSQERDEPPDIDVDFEHERREEVIQWIYKTYGKEKAALCATVNRYRAKGAIRDVGKALGLPEDLIKALSSGMWSWSQETSDRNVRELNLNPDDRRLTLTLQLAQQLMGAPRHLGQHPGGFVLTHDRLDDLVPIEPSTMEDRQIIEWDKDDVEALKFMKVDVLALGMLTCMSKVFALIREHKGDDLDLAKIRQEDKATYEMICKADTLGTFQIESRAQMAMLPRLKPKTFYDLVVQVAIVRPGPIQGDMVHPYLRRREKKEDVDYPTPELEAVLGKTLGVPLFQESAMRVAMVCAGFTGGEADQLRKSMATFKFTGGVSRFKEKLVSGMVKNGYTPEFAEKTFSRLEGFGSYGFPESHAASFALIAYASNYVKCHFPDVFCAALLNSQPMGFYAPAQIVGDARAHGVEVRPVCVNRSRWDCTLERIGTTQQHAVRLGMRMVKGLVVADVARIVAARMNGPFDSVDDMWRRSGVPAASLVELAHADAFQPSLKLARRDVLWAIKALRDEPLPLFAAAAEREMKTIAEQNEPEVELRQMTKGHNVVEDYGHIGLTLRDHPIAFLRTDLAKRNIVTCEEAMTARDGRWVITAGLVLVRQKPGSAKGVMFITIEDETGPANIVVWPKLFEKRRRIVLGSSMMAIHGRIQREGEVVHLIAQQLFDLTSDLSGLADRDMEFKLPTGRGDEFAHGSPGGGDSRDRSPPKPRDIVVPLCRARHKGIDPEPETMPSAFPKPRDFR
ncbi:MULTISPECIES: error-prone DNA polymerase [Rhizobium/Agrobacterium group]|uniref:Error-prone DNA polymerase n=2 Tax=Rhizobium/Agrobacterium group TaxID=227290 RepID=DNAE2_ALLAM|nr:MULTISPECIES: error-prone DNA polymerase [Rhizobium/Agrobacterium group]B9JWL2.1 RecName: Full=Error-prone DNA polymerase [Allorhizobium ampelinum S4]ACM36640.1 DNA polymerase III alpha chain [Allorhizobium ampelinum S4]MUO27457.1 DNA polymerase III subunit alpha [Agrobacterium vitis]MUO42093.1 DNA polymerase III subunit alpha [Agrobacterium vitis]MUP09401.1 DNA polymerase III subunit alpha [Agrobacterium vitis]